MAKPWQVDSLPQKDSTEPGVKDLYKSSNVFVNGKEVVLYGDPDSSTAFESVVSPPSVTFEVVEPQLLQDALTANGPVDTDNVQVAATGQSVTATGANDQPRSGQALSTTSTTDPETGQTTTTVNTVSNANQSSSVTGSRYGVGYQALGKLINATITEALSPNKPWKSNNPGTGNGSTPAIATSKPNILQLYVDVGHAWVKNDGTHWCAGYVGSMLKRAGLTYKASLSAFAYLKDNGWATTWADPRDPRTWRYNDVMVIKGHVCFVRGFDPDTRNLLLAGGNQGQDCNECLWSGAQYFSLVKSVGRAWPTPVEPLPTVSGGKALTRVATHGGTSS
jgi:hypothetical protein